MLIRTEKQMEVFGVRLGKQMINGKWRIADSRRRGYMPTQALILALEGELGSGKTTFVRGFARGLHIRSRVTSPTFILARRYRIPAKQKPPIQYLWHLDLYRLRGPRELSTIHFQELVTDPKNIIVMEWADRVRKAIPRNATWITFHHHRKGRTVIIKKSKARKPKSVYG